MFENVSIKGLFWRSRALNSKVTDPIRLEFDLIQDYMPVLVSSKFDENLIKNECVSLEAPFSHYKSMGNLLDAQGHLTLKGVVRSGWNSNSSGTLSLSLLSASLTKIGSKLKALAWIHHFPNYKSSLSPIPLMVHIKFDQDWPTDLGDSIISLFKI